MDRSIIPVHCRYADETETPPPDLRDGDCPAGAAAGPAGIMAAATDTATSAGAPPA